MIKAAATDDPSGMGGVGTYTVTPDFSEIEFASGEELIQDGTPFTLALNTDSVDAAGKNIVGVLITMSYGENEEDGNGVGCGLGAVPPQPAPDTISGMASHLNYSNSAEGQNQGGSGSHEVSTVWYNSSVIGEKIEGLSESQIVDGLDSKGAGMGDYNIEISVTANSGSRPGCQNSDSGETVTYTVKLIVLDYSITPYIEIEDI
tara:strand:- start:475 stop:1086 length:612 start_codon:yes stop_codon:yes gene_type:complete